MRYRFGVIFNFERQLRLCDETGVFADVDRWKLLSEIVEFLTEDVYAVNEGRERCNEIEYLMNLLCDNLILSDHLFHENENYLKLCGILFSICETIVDVFMDSRFYEYFDSKTPSRARVLKISNSNFAVVVKPLTPRHR